ncbi:MAG: hypothetical protein M3Y85_10875 [Bacteroidota bacterium]|nr:hypothetical protein [Bacteroidota bacterium]
MSKVGNVLVQGLIAGAVGTAALMMVKWFERKISNEKQDTSMADAASQILDIKIANKVSVTKQIQWVYGTCWGIPRAMLSIGDVKGFPATALHFCFIYANVLIMEPALNIAPPLKRWSKENFAEAAINHFVYALAAGLVYDGLSKD